MTTQAILSLDATAQADLLRQGDISPLELMQWTMDRIVAVNPHIHAVIYPMFDMAIARAKQWSSARTRTGPWSNVEKLPPFWGVPFLIKDLTDVSGVPTGHGSKFMASAYKEGAPYPSQDDPIVTRFRQAGLIIVGKSNTPELGLLPTTEPEHYGPTKNPWDLTRTAGGSSGGAAAAVAAGLVPMAHASDAGGSIRIPASCCGLFGLKPSRHPLTAVPDRERAQSVATTRGEGRSQDGLQDASIELFTEHVITRSVRDSASMFAWLHGRTSQTDRLGSGKEMFGHPAETHLRIGYSTKTLSGEPVHPHCKEAVLTAADLLSSLGHHVQAASPQLDGETMTEAFMTLWAHQCLASVFDLAERAHRPVPEDLDGFEPVTRALVARGKQLTAKDLEAAHAVLSAAQKQVARFFQSFDVWLTPTLAAPPVPLGTFDYDAEVFRRTNAFSPFTPIVNVAGLPAMSLPITTREGLPIGVQCVGRQGEDETLLHLAFQVEEAKPWVTPTVDLTPTVDVMPDP